MKRTLIIVVLLFLFGNLRADFYRTKSNRYIADVAFSGNQILVLENRSQSSVLSLLDLEGNQLSETEFQQQYEELYIYRSNPWGFFYRHGNLPIEHP